MTSIRKGSIKHHVLTAAVTGLLVAPGGCRQGPPASVTMTTGQGKVMTLTMQTLRESRGYLYCELVFNYGDRGLDIYSTSPLAKARLDWWNALDLEALAREFGALSVFKNGPQWWSMDEVGVMASQPVQVAGIDMVFGAHLAPGTMRTPKYTVFHPAKTQNLVWKAGRPVYQLADADGHVYILQGHKVPEEGLATLGRRFKHLPKGWEYRVKVLGEDRVMKPDTQRANPIRAGRVRSDLYPDSQVVSSALAIRALLPNDSGPTLFFLPPRCRSAPAV